MKQPEASDDEAIRPFILPCSRSSLDRLGKRLAARGTVSSEDAHLLAEVLLVYSDALAVAETIIRPVLDAYQSDSRVALALTTRVKTTATIRQKLSRERGMGMKGMRDIAGARITGPLNRRQQDDLALRLVGAFTQHGRPPHLVDRRANPSYGYRALHVVVHVDDLPIEIQLRTASQNSWAQLIEKLGDAWGRGLRYGVGPDEPNRVAFGTTTRAALLATLMAASDEIDQHERALVEAEDHEMRLRDAEATLVGLEARSDADVDALAQLREQLVELRIQIDGVQTRSRTQLEGLRRRLESFEDLTEGGADE